MAINLTRILALKEVSDFIQIGLVSYQSGRRFSGIRSIRGGSVSIDGGTVRVNLGGVVSEVPIEDAAADAGAAGAAGRGRRPDPLAPGFVVRQTEETLSESLGFAQAVTGEVVRTARGVGALDLVTAPGVGLAVGRALTRPTAEGVQAAALGPDPDRQPFTLREFILTQEVGKDRRQAAAIAAESSRDAQQLAARDRLAALDAQIDRERLAAQTDISRERIVADLTRTREEIAARFGLQERELESRLQLQNVRGEQEERQLTLRFGLQEQVNTAERTWRTDEAERDRQWRVEQARAGEDWGAYWKNALADRALGRSLEAAEGIARVLRDHPTSQRGIVSFASVFGRG